MFSKICDLFNTIQENIKKRNESEKIQYLASEELESVLRTECEAYDKICNCLEKVKKDRDRFPYSGYGEYSFKYEQGLEESKAFLKDWLIAESFKKKKSQL